MVNFVKTLQLLAVNGTDCTQYNFQSGVVTGQTRDISCVDTTIVGAYWRIPIVRSGLLPANSYSYEQAIDSVKPTPDSVKVLRVKWRTDVYDFAIADSDYVGTFDQFATLCDGLGGSLATMPTITIPFPILQQGPSSTDSDGTKHFTFPFPLNALGLLYSIPWPWFNGDAPGTAYVPAGITTPALFVTWANTNWSTYGTWTSVGNIVSLSSPTSAGIPVTQAGLGVSLTPAAWCIDLTGIGSPTPVNGIKFGSGSVIPFGAFALTSSNMQTLINAIRPFFDSGAVLSVSGSHKINITTVLATPTITNNGSVIVTATAGVCS